MNTNHPTAPTSSWNAALRRLLHQARSSSKLKRVLSVVILAALSTVARSDISSANDSSSNPVGTHPNIVVCVADDWSWPHASILGDPVVETPVFDRVASEGVLFENAFVSTPSCTPSRLSILTGQHHWRLREGDSLGGSLREEYPVYTDALAKAGYHVGRFGKGVWPSKHQFRHRDSFGERFRSFDQFLTKRAPNQPFCFWYGGRDPHRPYDYQVGQQSGMDVDRVAVPACLPDNDTTRRDVADYLWCVQRFDREVGEIISRLEEMGELENTVLVVSSDNGMPFPRCKATLYDQGTRVPLAIRWGAKVNPNRRVSDFVSLCDLAPTFMEIADQVPPKEMTGKSLLEILQSTSSGRVDHERQFVLTGVEKHVYSYPRRAIRTADYLYIRNFNPQTWRTGEVNGGVAEYDFGSEPWPTEPGAFSFAIDPSPSKQLLRLRRNDAAIARYAKLAFEPRPREELYVLASDPDQLHNVADAPAQAPVLDQMRRQLVAELIKTRDPRTDVDGYVSHDIEGWPVRISEQLRTEKPNETSKAVRLLGEQLRKVKQIVPASTLARIIHVPIWLSPPYDGFRPTGEYHPGENWLRKNNRPVQLHECVEFSNTAIFEKEIKRMPVMVLHELAHAYHHQVLGHDNQAIRDAFDAAKESGIYNGVLRGNGKVQRAYAMSNPMEYFAELSEALLGENDFYPFHRDQLQRHDPKAFALLVRLWDGDESSDSNQSDAEASEVSHSREDADTVVTPSATYTVESPPKSMDLPDFYAKYVDANGYPIVSSSKVNDYALKEAAYLIDMMLAERPDLRRAMVASGSRMIVMAHDEFTSDVPEHSHLRPKQFWDARARGLGGSRTDAVCSCGEENLLGFEGDPYSTENILIHEFAHNIHYRGMDNLDPTFDDRLKQTYDRAMAQGLWKSKYASTNHAEYFAEGVQSWFDNNRQPDHDHNHVDTRAELKEYDPGLAAMCEEVFGKTELAYTKPATRLEGHLEGYDPDSAPAFQWPEHLLETKKKIIEDVKKQGDKRAKVYKN